MKIEIDINRYSYSVFDSFGIKTYNISNIKKTFNDILKSLRKTTSTSEFILTPGIQLKKSGVVGSETYEDHVLTLPGKIRTAYLYTSLYENIVGYINSSIKSKNSIGLQFEKILAEQNKSSVEDLFLIIDGVYSIKVSYPDILMILNYKKDQFNQAFGGFIYSNYDFELKCYRTEEDLMTSKILKFPNNHYNNWAFCLNSNSKFILEHEYVDAYNAMFETEFNDDLSSDSSYKIWAIMILGAINNESSAKVARKIHDVYDSNYKSRITTIKELL